MAIINHSGIDQLLVVARKENPWLPHGATTQNIRVTDVTVADGKATGIFSGRYGSGYEGFARVSYSTIDLSKLFASKPLVVGVLEPKPLHELLDDIFRYTGINFGVGDIENQEPGHELPYTTTLRAKPLSAAYTGEVSITFQQRQMRIDEVITRDDYSVVFRTPGASNTDRARGEHFTYGTDYTTVVDALKSFPVGILTTENATALAQTLNTVDGLPWVATEAEGFWSLLNNNVVFNGPALAYEGVEPNLRFTHVIVVDMIADNGPGDLHGSKLYIHYNVLE